MSDTNKPYVEIRSPNDRFTVVRNTRGVVNKSNFVWSRGDDVNDDSTPGVDGSHSAISVDMDRFKDGYDHTVNLHNLESMELGDWWLCGRIGSTRLFKSKEMVKIDYDAITQGYLKTSGNMLHIPWARQDFPWGFAGDVTWELREDASLQQDTPNNSVIPLGTTRLEYYGITSRIPSFFRGSIDVVFLRKFLLPARSSSAITWPRHVAKAAFWDFGFRYNCYGGGAPAYASGYTSETFHLRRWTRDAGKNELVNCYDQAGLVQIALSLAGPTIGRSQIMYLSPFGYINTSELVGRGLTNNPFPGDAEKAAKQAGRTDPQYWLVDRNSPDRTTFGNHTFVRLGGDDGFIIDACAGPHVGTESLQEYIDAAISKQAKNRHDSDPKATNLYSDYGSRPAKVEDLSPYHRGVTAIDACPIKSPKDVANKEKTSYSKASMAKARSQGVPDEENVQFKLSDITNVLSSAAGIDVQPDLRGNQYGAYVTYDLPYFLADGFQKDAIDVQIGVFKNNKEAQAFFEYKFDSYHHKDPKHWVKLDSSEAFSKRLSVASAGVDGKHGVLVWVRGQVFLRIEGHPSSQQLWEKYGSPLDQVLQKAQKNAPESFEVTVNSDQATITINNNYTVNIGVTSKNNIYWTVFDNSNTGADVENLDLFRDLLLPKTWNTTTEGTTVEFARVYREFIHTVHWQFIDVDNSLRVYTKDIEVEVVSRR